MINPKKYIVLLNHGEKPTIPSPENIRPSSIYWKKTDILIGEWAYNVFDKKWYTRDSLGIIEKTDERFKIVGDSLTEVFNYINGLGGGLPSYFELVNEGLSTEYLRLKKTLAVDHEILVSTNDGQFLSPIWEHLPLATPTTVGGIKLNSTQFEFNADSQLTIKDAVVSPKAHIHYQLYQPDGSNPFVYTDNYGQLHIDGNIIHNGSVYETHAEHLYIKNNTIVLRDEATVGLATGEYSGFVAKLYDGITDGYLVYDKDGIARVGDIGSLQPLATRIESPTNGYFSYWESSYMRLNFKQIERNDLPATVVFSDKENEFGDFTQIFNGDINIGTTQSNRKLEVNGDIRSSSSIKSGGNFELYNSSGLVKWSISLNQTTDELDFYNASGVKEAWVDQNGNLKAKGELTAYAI